MELVKALNLSCFKDKCQTLACIKIHCVLYKGYCTADFCIAHAPPGVSGRWEKKNQAASWKIMKLNFREAIKPNSHEPRLIAAKHTVNISSKEGEQTQVHEYQPAAWRGTSLDTSTSKGCKLGNPGVLQLTRLHVHCIAWRRAEATDTAQPASNSCSHCFCQQNNTARRLSLNFFGSVQSNLKKRRSRIKRFAEDFK